MSDEQTCVDCGKPNDEHVLLYHGAGSYSRVCGFWRPKPPAPKAKPGVRYERPLPHNDGTTRGIGLASGRIQPEFGYARDFTPDWIEVPE